MASRIAVVMLLCCAAHVAQASKYDATFFTVPSVQYPVITPELVAGVGAIDIALDFPVLRSVAVVGADEISAHWLKINNDYLQKINAIGVVVNVESAEQLSVLQLYADIPLMAVSGFSAEAFGNVYPYVVDARLGRVRQ